MRRSTPVIDDPDVRLLHALADPTRLAIVRELTGSPSICACDFTATCGVSQPTVSHHLRVLREAGVVRAERRGTSLDYSLVPGISDRLAGLARGLVPG
jgi:ArsR family transcriptional regulator